MGYNLGGGTFAGGVSTPLHKHNVNCKYSVLHNVMKDSLLIVGVILQRWSVKTSFLSSLRR